MTIGQKIRNFRVDQGLTVKDFAKEIGYSPTAVSSWEANTRVPKLLATKDLSDYMGITIDDFLKGVEL